MAVPAKKLIKLLIDHDPASAEFRDGVRESLGPRPLNERRALAELDLWKDVFVQQELPWGRFLQSALLHGTALLLIWADLGRMGRAAYVMFFANLKSPMAWMIWFYSGFLFVVTLQLLVLLRGELDILKKIAPAWQPGANLIRRLAIVGFVLAIIFPTAVGVLFGVLAARPHWHSALIPILFLLSSIVSGCAALCVVLSIFQDGWRANRDLVVTLARIIRENEDAEAHFCYKHGV